MFTTKWFCLYFIVFVISSVSGECNSPKIFKTNCNGRNCDACFAITYDDAQG